MRDQVIKKAPPHKKNEKKDDLKKDLKEDLEKDLKPGEFMIFKPKPSKTKKVETTTLIDWIDEDATILFKRMDYEKEDYDPQFYKNAPWLFDEPQGDLWQWRYVPSKEFPEFPVRVETVLTVGPVPIGRYVKLLLECRVKGEPCLGKDMAWWEKECRRLFTDEFFYHVFKKPFDKCDYVDLGKSAKAANFIKVLSSIVECFKDNTLMERTHCESYDRKHRSSMEDILRELPGWGSAPVEDDGPEKPEHDLFLVEDNKISFVRDDAKFLQKSTWRNREHRNWVFVEKILREMKTKKLSDTDNFWGMTWTWWGRQLYHVLSKRLLQEYLGYERSDRSYQKVELFNDIAKCSDEQLRDTRIQVNGGKITSISIRATLPECLIDKYSEFTHPGRIFDAIKTKTLYENQENTWWKKNLFGNAIAEQLWTPPQKKRKLN